VAEEVLVEASVASLEYFLAAFVEALVVVVEPYLPWLSSLGKAGNVFKESGRECPYTPMPDI
jgi:hypothetical protein